MLLQHHSVCELLLTDRAGVLDPQRGHGPVDTVVSLQITLGGKRPAADLTLEGSFPSVSAIVHFQSTLTAQHPVADDTFVWVCHLPVNVLHKLLQFGGL